MDWASRRVLAWRLSNTMDTEVYLEALTEAVQRFGGAEVFDTASSCQRARSGRSESRDLVSGNCRSTVAIAAL